MTCDGDKDVAAADDVGVVSCSGPGGWTRAGAGAADDDVGVVSCSGQGGWTRAGAVAAADGDDVGVVSCSGPGVASFSCRWGCL